MTETDVSIIDYGLNNLKSVSKGFEKIGRSSKVVDTPEEVLSAKCLVLPGIGAFEDGMNGLKKRALINPIKQKVSEGTPLFGICLGMQMLFTESEEFGLHKGLDLIKGRVIAFKPPGELNLDWYKVPHMGWNEIITPEASDWKGTFLEETKEETNVYFVHSFYPIPEDKGLILANTEHGKQVFASVVKKGSIIGTQFHPEKSGEVGLAMLKSFCDINNIGKGGTEK
ncbi:MAG: imidazole glycerol phosphate synthase subunit HisH [archaeon]|nr:imidazole glycerol phosphate synthase subunit HisH [Euryarchaeota archaeon]MDP7260355.1 imidazole glycerol phosphate synthase subunit HisH [archaeon]HIK01414.1 imidazole glycerol phosphate synthase subunit HisH [Candidatus Undinarchaeales archaeon ERR594346 U_76725]